MWLILSSVFCSRTGFNIIYIFSWHSRNRLKFTMSPWVVGPISLIVLFVIILSHWKLQFLSNNVKANISVFSSLFSPGVNASEYTATLYPLIQIYLLTKLLLWATLSVVLVIASVVRKKYSNEKQPCSSPQINFISRTSHECWCASNARKQNPMFCSLRSIKIRRRTLHIWCHAHGGSRLRCLLLIINNDLGLMGHFTCMGSSSHRPPRAHFVSVMVRPIWQHLGHWIQEALDKLAGSKDLGCGQAWNMSTFKDALIILLQIAALPVTHIHNSTIAMESFFLTLCRSLVKGVDSLEEWYTAQKCRIFPLLTAWAIPTAPKSYLQWDLYHHAMKS